MKHILFFVAILAVLGVDCARGAEPAAGPAPYSYAFAMPDCAPWDGPAVVLYLLDSDSDALPPATRHVRVTIWKGAAELAHHTFHWPANPQPGAAAQCSSAGSCEAVVEGQIAFGAVAPNSFVEGELDLRFGNGERVRRAFKAAWRARRVLCG
jgi:hypothetical protein